ncbi:MAG: uracil-DNA glycosylase [Clostridiaceae bacterium]|nr:uracil-DNA glycosylase [Clostridiaceae bacterium]
MYSWDELIEECRNCTRCDLCKTRTNVVVGRGSISAVLMLIGEGPGRQEDEQGLPFVGAAGKLLDSLLNALRIKEDMYYIANIVKCRPPSNRVPREEEAQKCLPYLRTQVRLINPKIIVCLGATAIKYIIDKDAKITQIRGQWFKKQQFWIMPTFHPAALLRDESKKTYMWEDFKKVRQKLDEILNA